MKSLVTIVVPIYNVEDYLEECICSLIDQTYKNIEILLIDDGSTDNSGYICEKYKLKDDRIRVYHKKNGGLSDARNYGLERAKGDYICFIDSDDFINLSFIEILVSNCEKNKCDISICEYIKVTEYQSSCHDLLITNKLLSGKKTIEKIYNNELKNVSFTAWNKLYKKDLFTLNNIKYPKGKVFEDAYTTFKLLYYSENVTICEIPLYYYRVRSGSIMNSNMDCKKIQNYIDADICPIEFYGEKNEKELLKLALNSFYVSAIKLFRSNISKENKVYVKSKYIEIWNKYKKYNKFNIIKMTKYTIYYCLFKK